MYVQYVHALNLHIYVMLLPTMYSSSGTTCLQSNLVTS